MPEPQPPKPSKVGLQLQAAFAALDVPDDGPRHRPVLTGSVDSRQSVSRESTPTHLVTVRVEVRFGIPSGMEACLLPQLIGWGKTRELIYTGDHIEAAEAYRCGFLKKRVEQ